MSDTANRQRRLGELWTWLPAFRRVAERQSIQRAAAELNLSASSLSRAVGLVEDRIGKQLFDRVGRNLRLNRDGLALLEALRDGMRRIDDGVALITGTVFRGDLRLVAEGDQLVGPLSLSLARLRRAHPALSFTIFPPPVPISDLPAGLLGGAFDVAFVIHAPPHARLTVEKIGSVTYGIYCGARHPLARSRARSLKVAAVTAHGFVAPTPRADGASGDEWPAEIDRTVTLHVPSLAPAMAVAIEGDLLIVLPDSVAANATTTALRRLPIELVKPSPIYAVRRQALVEDDVALHVVREMKTQLHPRSEAGRTARKRRP